jgi:hypothetical protein
VYFFLSNSDDGILVTIDQNTDVISHLSSDAASGPAGRSRFRPARITSKG